MKEVGDKSNVDSSREEDVQWIAVTHRVLRRAGQPLCSIRSAYTATLHLCTFVSACLPACQYVFYKPNQLSGKLLKMFRFKTCAQNAVILRFCLHNSSKPGCACVLICCNLWQEAFIIFTILCHLVLPHALCSWITNAPQTFFTHRHITFRLFEGCVWSVYFQQTIFQTLKHLQPSFGITCKYTSNVKWCCQVRHVVLVLSHVTCSLSPVSLLVLIQQPFAL